MPRRWHQVRREASLRAGDGGKKARSPGRARRKPLKPLRGECRVTPVNSLVTNSCASTHYHSHTRLRVRRAPGIPCALCCSRGELPHSSGAQRRENAKCVGVIARHVKRCAKHDIARCTMIASPTLADDLTGVEFEANRRTLRHCGEATKCRRQSGLPRRFAPLRKRFAFVAGNDEPLNRFSRIRHRGGEAAVDRDGLAVDVGGLVARQEQSHRREFMRLAGALQAD